MDLLQQSAVFHSALANVLDVAPPILGEHPRYATSAAAALLAIEHACAARVCFTADCPQSATAVIRLQYEAAVRAGWLLYVASDAEIDLLDGPLNENSELLARKLPGASVMLESLKDKALVGLAAQLQQFHTVAWHGLNSFVHAGIHPLRRHSEGYPVTLAGQMIRNSNGLLHVSFRLLAALTGSEATMAAITGAWEAHRACLPIGE